jgi:hypothetical protein
MLIKNNSEYSKFVIFIAFLAAEAILIFFVHNQNGG